MDQLPRLGKRELTCMLMFTCNYVVSVRRGFLFFWVLGMGVRLYDGPDLKLFILDGCTRALSCVAWFTGVQLIIFLLQSSSGVVWQSSDQLSRNTLFLLSPCLCFFIVFKCDLFVYRDDSLTS